MITFQDWNDLTNEPLTLENVKKRYIPANKFRIQKNSWDPSDSLTGFWKYTAGYTTYYIQQGSITFLNEDTQENVTVAAQNIINLPKGNYLCRIISDIRLDFIQVLEIPDSMYADGVRF